MKKLKKGLLLTTFLFFAMLLISSFGQVKAMADSSKYLNIKMLRNSGYGYQVANGTKNVWKIYEVGGNADDTIYCLKGGPGFGSSNFVTATPKQTHYTRYFNLKNPTSIPATYQTALPSINSKEYKAILWILDNCYVAPKLNSSDDEKEEAAESRQILLDAAAEYAIEEGNPDVTDYELSLLTDDDIDAVQQLAIWYYTNKNDEYHVNTFEFWLNAVKGTDASYTPLSDDNTFIDGWERAAACQALFDYLVKTPQQPGFSYTITNDNSNEEPVKLANTTVTTRVVGGNLVIGPYRIEEIRNIKYSLSGRVNDKYGNPILNYTFLDSTLNPVNNTTDLKGLIGKDFYISIPNNTNIEKIEFQISGTFFNTTPYYWSVENPDQTKDQPVVIVEKNKVTFKDSRIIEYISISVEKVWEDNNNQDGIRPTSIQVQLKKNGVSQGNPVTLNEANNWTHTFTNLPKNENGNEIDYTVDETKVASGYTKTITGNMITGFIIKNIYTPGITQIKVEKIWEDNDNQDLMRPTSIQVQLKKNGVSQGNPITLNEVNNWTHTFTNLPKKENGKEIEYTVDEVSVPSGYTKTITGNMTTGFIIKNTYTPEKYFDLSLRKFITKVEDGKNTKNYDRAPMVDISKLNKKDENNKLITTATYNHDKTPIGVSNGNIVTYTIRVYNEGELDGYVTEITDHLPEQLEFIVDDTLNAKYGWKVASSDARSVTTNITSPNTSNSANRDEIYAERTSVTDKTLLKAFDGTKLDYIDLQIRCKVKEDINLYQKITNIADVTGFSDSDGNAIEDRDSKENNVNLPSDTDLPTYNDEKIERGDKYIPGQEDDDDFEKLVLQRFDLALRKFITGVNENEITSRAPVFTKVNDTEYKYEHTKEPVEVAHGNTVVYTLRIFNEGNISGYASEIKDDLPEGLEFLPDNEINETYLWKMYKEDGTETKEIKEASYIKTNYLSKAQEKAEGDKLIDEFNPETMTMPDYKDLKIAFKVTEPNTSDRIIINTAEITDDSDKNGKEIDDVDSTPNNNNKDEDDIDIEKIKVKYFDLALKKWVTESIVTYNGKTTVTKTGHTENTNPETPAKVEIRGSRISKTTVKFKFNIKVTNEGEIAGYVKELIDYIPQGLKFVKEDNPKWREKDGKVLTDQLKDTLLQPGESTKVEIILTWINNKDNLGLKTNWAEIYEDYNEYDSPDIDSTPGNNTKGEDDIDDAPVILTVVTGSIPTYITIALASVVILASGVILIKKFVI